MSYILFSGGFIIWPIILLSIISLAIIIEKSWNLARDIVLPKDLTKDIISQIKKKSLTSSMKEKMAQDSMQIVKDCVKTIKSIPIKNRIDDLRSIIQNKEKSGDDTSKELTEVMKLQKNLIHYRS